MDSLDEVPGRQLEDHRIPLEQVGDVHLSAWGVPSMYQNVASERRRGNGSPQKKGEKGREGDKGKERKRNPTDPMAGWGGGGYCPSAASQNPPPLCHFECRYNLQTSSQRETKGKRGKEEKKKGGKKRREEKFRIK